MLDRARAGAVSGAEAILRWGGEHLGDEAVRLRGVRARPRRPPAGRRPLVFQRSPKLSHGGFHERAGRRPSSCGAARPARPSPTSRCRASACPSPVVRWLGRIKAAAARVNAELGPARRATSPSASPPRATRSPQGDHDDQFPIDVFQTGSGTSSNMNANEVIATLAGEGAHPNDHVNMGQSSNDVFPSAVHLAALDEATNRAAARARAARGVARRQGRGFEDIVKSGRTHLMDAVPVTLGQEFARLRGADPARRAGACATRCRRSPRSRSAAPRPAPASTRTPSSPSACARGSPPTTGLTIRAARGPVRGAGQPRRAGRAVGRAEGRRRLADQDRQRPRADGLGPARRHRRAVPARAAEGLLDHARQGQPGDARGRAPGLRAGDRQRHRDHGRRHAGPVRAQRAHPADRAQPAAVDPPAGDRVASCSRRSASTASRPTSRAASARPRATLAAATALNPYIGYDKGAEIVKDASASGRTLREVAREHGVDEATLDKALDLRKIAAGSSADRAWARTPACSRRSSATATGSRARRADVEDHGPFHVFVSRIPWRYYARPRWAAGVAAEDVRRGARAPARARRARAFEWVARADAVAGRCRRAAGWCRRAVPLMALEAAAWAPAGARASGAPAAADDPALGRAHAAVELALRARRARHLSTPGRARATRWRRAAGTLGFLSERIARADRDGRRRGRGGSLAAGSAPAAGDVAEITGVGTLPAARRRGWRPR